MKQYIPLIESTLKHPDYFCNAIDHVEKIKANIQKKDDMFGNHIQQLAFVIFCLGTVAGYFFFDIDVTSIGIGVFKAFASLCVGFMSSLLLTASGLPFLFFYRSYRDIKKEKALLADTQKKISSYIKGSPHLLQDLSSLVKNEATQASFNEMIDEMMQNLDIWDKLEVLLSNYQNYCQAELQKEKRQKILADVILPKELLPEKSQPTYYL